MKDLHQQQPNNNKIVLFFSSEEKNGKHKSTQLSLQNQKHPPGPRPQIVQIEWEICLFPIDKNCIFGIFDDFAPVTMLFLIL